MCPDYRPGQGPRHRASLQRQQDMTGSVAKGRDTMCPLLPALRLHSLALTARTETPGPPHVQRT